MSRLVIGAWRGIPHRAFGAGGKDKREAESECQDKRKSPLHNFYLAVTEQFFTAVFVSADWQIIPYHYYTLPAVPPQSIPSALSLSMNICHHKKPLPVPARAFSVCS
jgi:hypothetical protein